MSYRKKFNSVAAVLAGGNGAGQTGVEIARGDLGAGHNGAARIRDGTDDSSGCDLRDDCQGNGEQQCEGSKLGSSVNQSSLRLACQRPPMRNSKPARQRGH